MSTVDSTSDSQSLDAWFDFLSSYSNGDFSHDGTPAMPSLTPILLARMEDHPPLPSSFNDQLDTPAYSSTTITREMASQIREFYVKYHYLPPPRTSKETLREQVIAEYDLFSPAQIQNVQASLDLLAAFFPRVLVTFSLFRNRAQHHFAVSGPEELIHRFEIVHHGRIPAEQSLCGHAILLPGKQMFIPTLQGDWRYRANPFRLAGFKSYIGSAVTLDLHPERPQSKEEIAIGTLNVCFTRSETSTLTAEQSAVVRHITGMLQTQLKATWEGHRRSREARANLAISGFIDDALASHDPTRLATTSLQAESQHPGVDTERLKMEQESTTNGSDPVSPLSERPGKLEEMARKAVGWMKDVLHQVDGICIVDLRSVQAIRGTKGAERYFVDTDSPHPTASLAHHRSAPDIVFPDFRKLEAAKAIGKYLETSGQLVEFSFQVGVSESGLEEFLPVGTRSHVAMPFFVPGDPLFLIVLTSKNDRYMFDSKDMNIIRTLGSILRAQALQARMVAADATKTAFLSSISHELRTPMHGVLTGLQLARNACGRREWDQLPQMLGVAESSGKTLQHLLNDVLDFGSIGKQDQKESRRAKVDLARSAREMAMACSTRMAEGSEDVDLIVQYEDRDWIAMIDEAGYHRILINGLSNAIKFTKQGSITLRLEMTTDMKSVHIRIVDTGIGIKAKFAPRLFEPFTKSDSFSPGAGLGLYITKGLVDRMSGTLSLSPNEHGGTTFESILPIELLGKKEKRPEIVTNHVKGWMTEDGDAKELAGPGPSPSNPSAGETTDPDRSVDEVEVSAEPPATTDRRPQVRVLVADDNEISRKLLLMALKRSPTKVVAAQAANGQEALEKFREFQPDLFLTDVSMPVMDGLTAAGRMRQLEKESGSPRCRIYAITGLGNSDPRLQKDSLRGEATLDGWLVKGEHGLEVIYDIVKDTLNRKRGE